MGWEASHEVLVKHTSFSVDRSTLFNPITDNAEGWSIWKGSRYGTGIEGEEQQDERSLAVTQLNLSAVLFKDCCENPTSKITGEAILERLKAEQRSFIRADAMIAQALFDERGRKTLRRIRKTYGKTSLDFPGTEIRCPEGNRHILQLFYDEGKWYRFFNPLENNCDRESVSVLIRTR